MRVNWWWSGGVSLGDGEGDGGVLTVFAREQRLAAQHLGQNTAYTPHVDRLGILLERQHDLWRTVPARSHIFRHEARVVFLRSSGASQAEVADFQVAVRIEKEVGGLEVAVKNVGGMHGLQRAEGLVDEVLAVVVRKVLGSNDTVHVRLHELLLHRKHGPRRSVNLAIYLNEIDLTEGLVASWLLDIQYRYDILVIEVSKQLHLAKRSQTEHGMVEWGNLLNGDLLP